ncbi:hypothetical protein [Hymenobacter psoromatis]|uniref:hypothetical protein n=1 Tax=Hymenobacter psoromatis TaxID=1484116 RepID=UPI001CBD9127|nr:hypothetical protein [Hymenobacter psoromatis]
MLLRPPETLYFENQAGQLYYRAAGYAHLIWVPGRLPLAIIEAYYEQVLALLLSTNTRLILSEHGQRAPLSLEAQNWLANNWIPRAMRLGNVRHCAIVEGADPLHRLAAQSVMSTAPEGFIFQRFDAMRAAESWLLAVG